MQWNGFDQLDLTNVQEGGNHLKRGQYLCEVTKASVEKTNDKKGLFVQVNLRCLAGHGISIDRFNVSNANEKAVEIGLSKLKTFLIAAGHPNPNKPGNIASLSGLKVGVNVNRGKPFTNDKGETVEGRGEIAGYFNPEGVNVAGPAGSVPAHQGQAQPQPKPAGSDNFDDDIPF